jgi:polyhydroxyalkanoate synthesis regulator phasin
VTDQTGTTTETSGKGTASQSIRELIERTFLAGMGAAALTKDRIQEVVEEFVRRGQLDKEEGRDVVERLVERSREEARAVLKKADSSLQGAYRDIGLTPKRELDSLRLLVEQLEHRVSLLEAAADVASRDEAGGSAAR